MIPIRLLCLMSLLAACADTEDRRPSLIDNPRILAIATTPALLGPGQVATLDALVVNNGGEVASAEVSWRACAPWTVVLDPDVQCGDDSSTSLPTGELFAPQQLDDVVEVPVVAEAWVDGLRLVAVKRVRLVPTIPPIAATLVVGAFRLDGDAPSVVEAGREYEVDVDVLGVFPEGDGAVDARLTLYATAGEFADESVEISFDPETPEQNVTTLWTAPMAAQRIVFWLVATGPGGTTSWLQTSTQ